MSNPIKAFEDLIRGPSFTEMSEIPEDVMVAAKKAYEDGFERFAGNKIEAIAQAILAERDACAKIAESFLRGGINYDYESGSANGIAAAIRRR